MVVENAVGSAAAEEYEDWDGDDVGFCFCWIWQLPVRTAFEEWGAACAWGYCGDLAG